MKRKAFCSIMWATGMPFAVACLMLAMRWIPSDGLQQIFWWSISVWLLVAMLSFAHFSLDRS